MVELNWWIEEMVNCLLHWKDKSFQIAELLVIGFQPSSLLHSSNSIQLQFNSLALTLLLFYKCFISSSSPSIKQIKHSLLPQHSTPCGGRNENVLIWWIWRKRQGAELKRFIFFIRGRQLERPPNKPSTPWN